MIKNKMENSRYKFRAWDKYKKLFIPTDVWAICQTDFNAFGVMLKDWENYKEGEYFYSHSQELSQYTGLKDNNGKEIYEGDILKGISNNPFSMGEENNYEVMWGVDSWHIKGTSFGIQELQNYCNNNIEVVGNIYENPELLK